MPTKVESSDIMAAIYSAHGDMRKLIIAPCFLVALDIYYRVMYPKRRKRVAHDRARHLSRTHVGTLFLFLFLFFIFVKAVS